MIISWQIITGLTCRFHLQLYTRCGWHLCFYHPHFHAVWAAPSDPFFRIGHSPSGQVFVTVLISFRLPPPPTKLDTTDSSIQILISDHSPITSLLRPPSKLSPQSSHLKLTLPRNHTMACFPHRLLTMAFNANIIPTALHWFGLNHFFLLHLSSGSSTQPPATEPNHLPFPEVSHPVPPPSQSSHHLLNLECQPLILAYLLIDFPDLH